MKNQLTQQLNIQYPIIQAPMLSVTTPQMVAAVANEGGLGSLPVGGLSPERTRELIHQTKALTNKPFAVNLFTHDIPAADVQAAAAMQNLLTGLASKHNLPYDAQEIISFRHYHYTEQVDVLLDEEIPVVSFTFGMLEQGIVQSFKQRGVTLIGTATSVREAVMLDELGIDMITVQGIEAGGHRGTFITDEPLPQVGLMTLLPQVAQQINKPLIAAGAIADAAGIKAAFALGAQAAQVGTAFIASIESLAFPAYKKALKTANDTGTALTRAFSGRWARGLRNEFMQVIEEAGIEVPEYPYQNSLTGQFRAEAVKANNNQMTNMWAGQNASKAEELPTAEIFRKLVAGLSN